MNEQLRPITLEELKAGQVFIYQGDFNNCINMDMAFDSTGTKLLIKQLPEMFWDVDRVGGDFLDSDKYNSELPSTDWFSPGFRIWNPRYGFIQVLLSECKVKEAQGV